MARRSAAQPPAAAQDRDLFGDEEADVYEGMEGGAKEEYNPVGAAAG
jgi:hypothetical protein